MGKEAGGRFSLLEYPIPPRLLVAPLHCHTHEDEYSYVLEGRLDVQLGAEVLYAEPGDLVCKPRQQWHTLWNAGDELCRVLEIISPAGFERMFDQMATNPEAMTDEAAQVRYGIEMDCASIPRLCQAHGLIFES